MSATSASPRLPLGRRWLVRGLLAVATLVTVVAIFAVWANRQVLDADNWSDTSTELLQNDAIRTQLAGYLVDQAYQQVDVADEVARALPPRLEPLAGPAASAFRQLAENRTAKLLGRPRVQDAWRTANRVTMQQFIDIAEGDSKAITVTGGAVVLDLRPLVEQVITSLGGSATLAQKVPEDAAKIKIMDADQVTLLQDAVGTVQGLSAVLPGIAVALFALAVFLARARRRRTLMWAGSLFVFAGALVLVGRNLAGDAVVSSLASTASLEPAVSAVWDIGTGMLRDVAQATVLMGLPVVFAAWLAGPAKTATGLRRAAAPWLNTRPDIAYGGVALLLLLVIAWGPIHATRMVLPVLLFTVLAFAGMVVLRRQVAEEFPGLTPADTRSSVRGGFSRAAHAVSSARRGNGGPPPAAIAVAPPSRLDQLERLAQLHDRGALSDEEFAAEKAKLAQPEVVT
jgi:hypothetical protein